MARGQLYTCSNRNNLQKRRLDVIVLPRAQKPASHAEIAVPRFELGAPWFRMCYDAREPNYASPAVPIRFDRRFYKDSDHMLPWRPFKY